MSCDIALNCPTEVAPQAPLVVVKKPSSASRDAVLPAGKNSRRLKAKADGEKGQKQTAHATLAKKPDKTGNKIKTDGQAFVVKISSKTSTVPQKTDKISLSKEEDRKVFTSSDNDNQTEIGFKKNNREYNNQPISGNDDRNDAQATEETITTGLFRAEEIDLSAVQGDPKATIDKMSRIRQSVLMRKAPTKEDVMIAIHATSTASRAHREVMAEKTSQQEKYQLAGEQVKKVEDEEEEKVKGGTEKKEAITPLQSPSRYRTPMAGGGDFSTPRLSKPTKTAFSSKALKPTKVLGSIENLPTIQQRNFSKAFSTPQEAEPLLKIIT